MFDNSINTASAENFHKSHPDTVSWQETFPLPNFKPETPGERGHIEWASSLKDGLAQAQREGKPLVCVFEEDNCAWCKKFDQELTKPAAAELGQDAIFVHLSPSKDQGAFTLANNLGIDSYPTVSVLDVNGSNINERSRMTGFMTADQFAAQYRRTATVLV